MALFVQSLHGLDPGYTNRPIVDVSGIDGAWDFTLTMSGSRVFRNGGNPAGGSAAADPNGAISLFDAVEKQLGLKLELQKHPMPVLVIDHIEQKPSDN